MSGDLKVERPLDRAEDGTCADCPKHDPKNRWCPLKAERKAGAERMCRYGRALKEGGS